MQGGNGRNLSCSFAFEGKAPAGALSALGLRGSFVYLGRGYEDPISGRGTAYAPIWLPCKRPSAALFSPTRCIACPFILFINNIMMASISGLISSPIARSDSNHPKKPSDYRHPCRDLQQLVLWLPNKLGARFSST